MVRNSILPNFDELNHPKTYCLSTIEQVRSICIILVNNPQIGENSLKNDAYAFKISIKKMLEMSQRYLYYPDLWLKLKMHFLEKTLGEYYLTEIW